MACQGGASPEFGVQGSALVLERNQKSPTTMALISGAAHAIVLRRIAKKRKWRPKMLPERQDASGSNESREASEGTVKEGIHPYFNSTLVTCNTCNTKFETYSTSADLKVEICSACHPFYTGKVRALSQTGQVEKFRQRYTKAK